MCQGFGVESVSFQITGTAMTRVVQYGQGFSLLSVLARLEMSEGKLLEKRRWP